ncbi:MAG: hypothetical protein ACKVU2_13955 [Saprospiraceae bacterium]
MRQYLSLMLLFVPAVLFAALFWICRDHPKLGVQAVFPYLPWQFFVLGVFGITATAGGVLDWRYHRDPLRLRLSKKERDAEAAALGLGGVPMFVVMWAATMSEHPSRYLLPVVLILIFTVAAICYDEFVFHMHRCGKTETRYHRMLVFGNGIAWLAWFHYVFCQ